MKTIKLYAFEELQKYLDDMGYPKVNSDGILVIKTDFRKAYEEGKIVFKGDGIYLLHNGKEWKGYMYRRDYRVSNYGLPKFHLVKCEKIREFIDNHLFNQYYIWSNAETVDVIERGVGEVHKDCDLSLCNFCKNELIFNSSPTTTSFYETIKKEVMADQKVVQVDINGYTLDWDKISKEYKQKKEYCCERCGTKAVKKADYRFFHVHHKDGNKVNNNEENLECLCILCHSKVDNYHLSKIEEAEIEEYKNSRSYVSCKLTRRLKELKDKSEYYKTKQLII